MKNRLARRVALVGLLGIAVLAIGHVTLAGVVADSPELPPSVGVYRSQPGDYAAYRGVMMDDQIVDVLFEHSVTNDALNVVRTPYGPNQEDELYAFDSFLAGLVTVGDSSYPLEVMGPTEVVVLGKWGEETGTFATEIISMSLAGPMVGLGEQGLQIREDPERASTGEVTVTELGNGKWLIDANFNVFSQLSVDGGETWVPSEGGTQMYLVPEPTTLGLAIIGLFGLSAYRWRRRKRVP